MAVVRPVGRGVLRRPIQGRQDLPGGPLLQRVELAAEALELVALRLREVLRRLRDEALGGALRLGARDLALQALALRGRLARLGLGVDEVTGPDLDASAGPRHRRG